jgi:DNA primase
VIKRYDLFSCYQTGDYKYRIIAPIYFARRMVSFVGRDVSEEARDTYLNCPNQDSIIPAKRCLYNIDSVDKVALIVEGITDVWRIGRGTVATLGVEFTKAQINQLTGLDKVFVMFDAGRQATNMAHRLAAAATSVVKSVEVIEMTTGDPDKLPENIVRKLQLEIFGRR